MANRDNHYEAAFEEYLRSHGVPYVAVDKARRAVLADGGSIKSLDFVRPDALSLIEHPPKHHSNALTIGRLQVAKGPMNIGFFEGCQLVEPSLGRSKQARTAPVNDLHIKGRKVWVGGNPCNQQVVISGVKNNKGRSLLGSGT